MRLLPTFAQPKSLSRPEIIRQPPASHITLPTDTLTLASQSTSVTRFFGGGSVKIGHANDAMDDEGTTWIHYAALAGDLDVAKVLVKQANVNYEQLNKKGLTPLTVCAATGQHQVARLYRDHGAKLQVIYCKDAHGNIDESKEFIHPSDIAKKHSKDPATIHFFRNEEREELRTILNGK